MKKLFELMPSERLCNIVGYDGLFDITDFGRIVSYPCTQNGFKTIERTQIIDNRGYFRVSLGIHGVKKTFKVHRLVGLYFVDNPSGHPEINHLDGNKLNNYYKNLEWSTRKENMQHASKNGLLSDVKGSKNGFSILNESQVIDIFTSNESVKNLSIAFGVSTYCIYDIKNGKSWSHLTMARSRQKN